MILFHKISKVILTTICFGITGLAGIGIFQVMEYIVYEVYSNISEIKYVPIMLAAGILLFGILMAIYQLKSFTFLSPNDLRNASKRIQTIFWIGAYGFSVLIVLFSVWILSTTERSNDDGITYGFMFIALLFIIEVRATQLKYKEALRPKESDLDEIGNS